MQKNGEIYPQIEDILIDCTKEYTFPIIKFVNNIIPIGVKGIIKNGEIKNLIVLCFWWWLFDSHFILYKFIKGNNENTCFIIFYLVKLILKCYDINVRIEGE